MPENSQQQDAEIVRAAYADRVSEAFVAFAENISRGENEHTCTERFIRAMQLVRKARDLALGALIADAARSGTAAPAEAAKAAEPSAMEGLSAEDQAMIEQALSGTTGRAGPPPPSPITRR